MKIMGSLKKLRVKLLIAFMIVAVIPVFILGIISWPRFDNALEDQVYKQLESVRDIKKAQIEDFFKSRENDMDVLIETVSILRAEAINKLTAVRETKKKQIERFFYERTGDVLVLADSPFIRQALNDLGSAFEAGGGFAGGNFKGYNSEKYDAPAEYREVHDKYYPNLRYYMKQYGYYDLFLMSGENGDICFTVMKESDFGQRTGDIDAESLRNAWRIAARDGRASVSDTKPYAPSAGAPAQFVAAPVKENGKIIGVVALQISIDAINEIMGERTGLGETGETYLVGKDQLMRSDSFPDPANRSVTASFKDPSKGSVVTEASKAVFNGKTDAKVIVSYNGRRVLSAYTPVKIGDITWGLIAETEIAEAFCPKNESGAYFFAKYKEIYGYYDLFLINPDGYCFYTVAGEPDYQTDLVSGKYAESGLGKLTQKVLMTPQFGFSDFKPYEPSKNEPAAFIAQPLVRNGKAELVVALRISLDSITGIMNQRAGLGETGETYLVGSDNLMRSDSLDPVNYSVKASFANPDNNKVETDAISKAFSGKTDQETTLNYKNDLVLSSYTLLNVLGAKWALLAEVSEADAFEPLTNLRTLIGIFGLICVFIIVGIALAGIRVIVKPIKQVVEQFRLLAMGEGDLTKRVDLPNINCSQILHCGKHECQCYGKATHCWYEAGSYAVHIQCPKILTGTYKSCEECREVYHRVVYDEVTSLASYFNGFISKLQEMVKTIVNSVGVMSTSSAGLSEISEQMTGRAVTMSEKANIVATATEEMSANMNSVAAASEQASTNVKMVATATEEMATTVNEIAQNSEKARSITNEAVYQAKSASDKVNKLGNAAHEISKVTEVITEISEQTNLLALNATIEAARAGEAGKGFAVVANEIKELARQTPEATQDIKNKIEDIQNSTTETVREIGQISDVINKVNEIVSIIATAVEEQSVTTREIAGNIANASIGIEEVNLNVAQSSSVAGDLVGDIVELNESAAEISESISQVNVNAEELSGLADQLKEMVDKFKV
ncbi:MAG: hypothetical protein GY749_00640 [Desulfobacteraceae bacterium]|nr:hypothetical protein [Desulfobacteraceae bacterium]